MSRIALAIVVASAIGAPARAEQSLSVGDAVELQAAMQHYIDTSLVDGAYLHLDEATGQVRSYYPAHAHPKIEALGKYYYLCTTFRDAKGRDVVINFYLAKSGGSYVVFHTIVGEDPSLEALIEKHALEPAS